jgi:hypothetical protein
MGSMTSKHTYVCDVMIHPSQPLLYLTLLYFRVAIVVASTTRQTGVAPQDMRPFYCLSLSSSLSTTMFASKNRSTHCLMQGSSYLSSLPFLTLPPDMHLRKQVSVRECIAAPSIRSYSSEYIRESRTRRTRLDPCFLALIYRELL